MDCKTCGPICGMGDTKDSEISDLQAEKHGSIPVNNLSQARYNAKNVVEMINDCGFTYEKCKFCGSIIVHDANNDYLAENFESLCSDETKVESTLVAAADIANRQQAECPDRANMQRAAINGAKDSASGARDNASGARDNASAYGTKLNEKGCSGICIQYDTRSCKGNRCKSCDVCSSGLCCKRYLINSNRPYLLERDGGDYRNLMGAFIRCNKENSAYDDSIRKKLCAEAKRADAYRDEMRRQVVGSDDARLVFEWREYKLNDLLIMFPHVIRRPIRIEIQLLIYLYYNYRYPVDLEHAETRFHLPKRAINRYMRAYYGNSYSFLLAKIRNEHSKLLLGIPLLRIGEIGALVGYKSHYHFSLSFKRYEGMSPKEYRQSINGYASDVQ